MLVAIAVISSFAALMIPVVSRVRKAGESVKCMENLRVLGLAMTSYISERGRYPLAVDDPDYSGIVPYWGPTWAEYLRATKLHGNPTILHCPSRPRKWATAAGYYPDYGYNSQLGNRRPSHITNPSKIVLFVDSAYPDWRDPVGGFYALSEATRAHFRHTGKTAWAIYLDGHLHSTAHGDAFPLTADSPLGFKAFYPDLD